MATRSKTVRSARFFRWLVVGLALAIGTLVAGSRPIAAQAPHIQVHFQNYDWVQGEVTPNAWVEITLKDALGQVKGTYSDWANGDGWFGGWCPEDIGGNCVDIAPGDTVEVVYDGSGPIVVPVIEITGTVDSAANTISGRILAKTLPARASVEIWGTRDGTDQEFSTDAAGNYSVDLSPYDVKPGHWVNIWYTHPEGHQVGAVFSELRLEVNVSDDHANGIAEAGQTVALTLLDSGSSVKGEGTAEVNYEGQFDIGFSEDIVPGDTVSVEAAGHAAAIVVPDPFSAEMDADADTVYGLGPAGAELRVDVYGYGDKWVTVQPDGTWSTWFGDRGDLQPNDQGEVRSYATEGHEARVRFYGQFLWVRVNHSHNWVDGETTPGSTIVATVWRDGVSVMADRTGNGGGSGWQIDFCCDDESELRTGDVVEVETSLGLTAMVEIVPLAGSVDANANTVSGQLFDVPYPAGVRVEVWTEDGGSVDGQTDASGNLSVDVSPFDLLPGHEVFLAYVRPDGHQVGIIRRALRLDVDTGRGQVSGETAPNTSVSVTIDGGETSTTTSDEEGQFWLQFSGDIAIGGTVEAWAGDQYASLVVEPVEAYIDAAADKVWGYGPPNPGNWDNLNVGVDDDWRWTRTDPTTGYFEVAYDWDVTPDDWLEVEYRYPQGHQTRYRFGRADVWVHKWAPVSHIVLGDEFSYMIEYGNDGGTATDVVIVDTLPDDVAYLWDDSGVSPTYDPVENTLVWNLGTLAGGQGQTFELRVSMDPDAPWHPFYRNYMDISADDDHNPDNNHSETDIDVWDEGADVWVEKELAGGLPIAGEMLTYRLRYGNRGARAASDVLLTDNLPADTTFESSTFKVGVEGLAENVDAGVVTWEIGTLEPSEEHEFEFSVRINANTAPGTFLTNEVVIGDGPEAEERDNRRLLNTVVETPAADLWVDKEVEGDLSDMGSEVVYRITFHNDGTVPAEDVILVDTLPAEMVHAWHSTGSVATVTGRTITWDMGAVPPGGGGQVLLGARIDGAVPPGTVMTNTIEISTSTPDLDEDNNLVEVPLGPPRVICVPWVGEDPHRVWSGLNTTLKGTAKGYGLMSFEWDPGDGSPVITGSVDDANAIEATHTYNAPVGTVFTAELTVWGAFGWSDSDTYSVEIFSPIHGVQKDVAIDEGLWTLHKSARRTRSGALPFVEWEWEGNAVAVNASAVQAFQVHGHRPGGDPWEDPYVEDVQAGWNALLTYSVLDPTTVQTAGDPDGDGNGVGIGMYNDYGHSIYESGLAMMALATTGVPDRVARTGPVGVVRGQTYYDIVQDMADWFAWGQNDAESEWARGGWRYQPNSGDSDNSNTQFPVLGLAAAEDNWGITVPDWVKTELRDYWLANTQNPSGVFGYTDPWSILNIGKTGAGIMDLVWTGVPVDDSRIVSATQYIEAHWNDPLDDVNEGGNVGDLYAMYAVKKGSQLAGILNYGPYFWDYEYSSYLVGVQKPDGRFGEDPNLGRWFGDWQPMATSWALLILSPGLYEALPVAIISPNQYGATEPEWYEGAVQFDGTASHHTDPGRELVEFEWDFGDGGTASGTLTPFHGYAAAGEYVVNLTVTDDRDKSDTDTLLLTVDNAPPAVTATLPSQSVQYSDYVAEVTFTATDVTTGLLQVVATGWSVDGGDLTSGLPGALTLADGDCTISDNVNTCTWALSGIVDVPAGTYTVRVTVEDDDGGQTDVDMTIVVEPEDALVSLDGDNPAAVQVIDPGEDSGPFSLTVYVKETIPDAAPYGAAAGDIGLAQVSMSLVPVGPGGTVKGTCTPVGVTGTGYDAVLEVSCAFDEVQANVYSAQVTVDGGTYEGYDEDVLVVHDPRLGFTTGGGWFYWPGTDERTSFSFNVKYDKKGRNVKGSLLLIRHVGDGLLYRIKSNVMDGLAVREHGDPPLGRASFSGKSTYEEPGGSEPEGNYEFLVYVEDRGEPGAGADRFWIEIKDRDGNVVSVMSMARGAAVTIEGGNIVIPHKGKVMIMR